MIIGIDIRPMAGLRTGVQEYTEQVVGHMIRLAPEHTFKLFFSSFRSPPPNVEWLRAPNVEVHHYRIPNNILFFSASVWGYPLLDDFIGGADVFFSPHFFLAPLSPGCRRVTTFHDLSFLRFPEFFTWRKQWWHTIEMNPGSQARFSDRIISVSESTKADLVEYYHVDPANISIVPLGVDMTRPAPTDIAAFKKLRQLPGRFILSVGTIEPRKNISGLVRAFNVVKQHAGFEDLELVIIGKRGWRMDDVFAEIKSSPFASAIRYLGHVPDTDRVGYYAAATVFAYPSFFEGFGSPVLEAMACGTPVVTSTNSSLPEVVGDAGIMVNPYNISDLAEALRIVLVDESVRVRMIQKGLARAAGFTWESTARQTLDILTAS